MPKPKFPPKQAPSSDDDTSDSGPEDRHPAKPAKRVAHANAGSSSYRGASASSGSSSRPPPAKKRKGNPAIDGQEPSWDLGKMKTVKVILSDACSQPGTL